MGFTFGVSIIGCQDFETSIWTCRIRSHVYQAPRHLSPLRLKAGADQCSEADGPTGQVASEDESTRLFPEPWFLVRLPPRPRSQTEDRVALKIEVNDLLKKGHLREFLCEKAKSHLSKETMGKPTEAARVSPPRQDRVIHVISGGSEISGISHAAAKKSTWNGKHGLWPFCDFP
ncbi:hypothetical protein DY000_02007626 [Brassica cretica]|uniref:Uncharacterized protein n=1 Tax=Brassica cretica TaxID=69181 RepID=A0ABQ7CB31_BRACR|nr:hypothetical protein DY000_02007626 [Brassica cretica]